MRTGHGQYGQERRGLADGEERYEDEIYSDAQGPGARTAGNSGQGQGQGTEWEKYLRTGLQGAKAAGSWAGQRANEGWSAANELAKAKGGVDLNAHMQKLGLGGAGAAGARGGDAREHGYGQMSQRGDEFFDEWDGPNTAGTGSTAPNSAAAQGKGGSQGKAQEKKKDGWEDDEWKDF